MCKSYNIHFFITYFFDYLVKSVFILTRKVINLEILKNFNFELYPENDLTDLTSIVLDLSLTYYAFRDKILILFFFSCVTISYVDFKTN